MKKVCQNVREGHRENIKWGIIARTTWGKGESDISMPSCCSSMLRSRKEDGRIVCGMQRLRHKTMKSSVG